MIRTAALCLLAAAAAAPAPPRLEAERLERLSRRYLGTPYRLDPAGEGRPPDADPEFTRAAVDCQTLVEQVLAEALAPELGGLTRAGRLVRYRGGEVRLENRRHYCIPDWLENPWPARDITGDLGATRIASLRLDLPALLARRGGDARRSPVGARTVSFRYLPRARAAALPPERVHGTIAVWVTNRRDTIAGHVGFLFAAKGGVLFRHASQRRGRVVDEPLAAYVLRAPRSVVGLVVLTPLAGLRPGNR